MHDVQIRATIWQQFKSRNQVGFFQTEILSAL